jgi:hypothetical protein
LQKWIQDWSGVSNLSPLKAEDWFWKGQGLDTCFWSNCDGLKFPVVGKESTFLWCPPPCLADVALEALRKSLHKRPQHYHIFVCPKLMTYLWRKTLLRTCDFAFYVDPGVTEDWPETMHESLLIGVYLPLLPCPPWTFRRSKSVLALEGKLRQVSKTKAGSQGIILRKFLLFARKLPTLQEGVVWSVLSKGRIR